MERLSDSEQTGPNRFRLFLIIPPGLEDMAYLEIDRKCPVSGLVHHKGGLEFSADLDWIIKAHALLKIPTRMLMRMTQFKVKDFPKLYKKFAGFKWNEFLSHPEPEWEISCTESRLMHTGRIEETAKSALASALVRQPLSRDWEKKNYPPQTFYVRIHQDIMTLSLDLTGDAMYKRGLQVIKGEAPLRENFAATFVMELMEGLNTPVTLVDPMCGSGTFLTEALTFHRPLRLRSFAFETAPFFKGKHFNLPEPIAPLAIKEALGLDENKELLDKIKIDLPIKFTAIDSLSAPIKVDGPMVMICNPPYGERIKIEGKRGVFLKAAWDKFLQIDRPLRFAWVIPTDMESLFNRPEGYNLRGRRRLKNGGLPVTFFVWERA